MVTVGNAFEIKWVRCCVTFSVIVSVFRGVVFPQVIDLYWTENISALRARILIDPTKITKAFAV